MALSRIAQEFADEIKNHDWSDAPYRLDRAGHDRSTDTNRSTGVLTGHGPDYVRWNAVVVTAQVLMYSDPTLMLVEYAIACGLPADMTGTVQKADGFLENGIRLNAAREIAKPGTCE